MNETRLPVTPTIVAGKRKIKAWQFALAIPVVLGLGGWITSEVMTRRALSEVNSELSKLKAMGIPTTPAAMRRKVDVNQNAADLYRRAMELHTMIGRTAPRLRRLKGGSYDPADLPAYRKWVASQEPTMKVVREAANKSDCDFQRNWELGANLLLPEFADMKGFVKIAAFKSGELAAQGKFRESMDWMRTGLQVARHAREPILIGQLVAIACESIVYAELQGQIDQFGTNPAFQQAARQLLGSLGDLPSIVDGMKGEVMSMVVTFDQLDSGELKLSDLVPSQEASGFDVGKRIKDWSMQQPMVRRQVEARILNRYRRHISSLLENQGDYHVQVFSDLDKEFMDDQTMVGQLATIFAPVFAQAGVSVPRLDASRRLTRCGLELWANVPFPEKLQGIHDWEIDPFTKKPFVYRRDKGYFVLYSVGANGKDEGGHRTSARSSDDIQFNFRRGN